MNIRDFFFMWALIILIAGVHSLNTELKATRKTLDDLCGSLWKSGMAVESMPTNCQGYNEFYQLGRPQ